MSRMRLVSLDSATPAVSDTSGSVAHSMAPGPSTILLTVSLTEDSRHTVFITNLNSQVAKGVLTATGSANIPGQGSDTFTAVVWAIDASDSSVMLTIAPGSRQGSPMCFLADVSTLLDHEGGAGRATDYVRSLVEQFLSGRHS